LIPYLPSRQRLGHALSLQEATPRYAGRQVGFAHNSIVPIQLKSYRFNRYPSNKLLSNDPAHYME